MRTQCGEREAGATICQILLVDWDTESDNIPPEHTETSPEAVQPLKHLSDQ